MSIDAELLLSPDVQIFPVRELAPQVRANVNAGDDDYAVTRKKSRAPSRIIDKDSAKLLKPSEGPCALWMRFWRSPDIGVWNRRRRWSKRIRCCITFIK